MPRNSRESEIIEAVRNSLKQLVKNKESITDEKLMAAASCSRRTFYKYVREGSPIKIEIETTRRALAEGGVGAGTTPNNDDTDLIRRLRSERDNAIRGAKELAAAQVRLISNLIDMGMPASTIDKAQRAAMSKPDRSVSRAGYPRGRKSRKR
jgi:hypothetical protein